MNTTTMPILDKTMERGHGGSLEVAGRNLEKSMLSDSSAPGLIDVMGINPQTGPTASGLTDHDYPSLSGLAMGLANFTQIKTLNKMPLPPEVMEHFGHMQCHCMMGLFTEVSRAWLTIDSDIYVWTYEHGSDVAYFDGLSETIVSVGLVKPKPGVFHVFIKYLLVLTTTVDIVVLGVTFTNKNDSPLGEKEEIHLVPDPVFIVPTDGVTITTVKGTEDGRLFLGGRDGSLFEIQYQAESSWFGKRFKKINHSTGTLSFLVPSFLNVAFSDEDPISQISIDNSRHILYTLTEKGSIEVFDLGEKGNSLYRVTKISQSHLVQLAMNIVKTLDSVTFRPIISISAVELRESLHINLVAVTQTGVRLYFAANNVTNFTPGQRPYTLQLVHVRLPPGFSANISTLRPKALHMADYKEGSFVLVSAPTTEYDQLWCISSDPFPFSSTLMEAYTIIQLDGPAWAMAEVKMSDDILKTSSGRVPPLVVRQHMEPPRKYVVLTAQGAHIFIKLRPVDMLRQLLVDSHGPESDAVKAYFHVQKEDQACATSLILACLESAQNADAADWATRAFFMYGGEPKILQNILAQTMRNPAAFNPALMSTPSHSFSASQFNQTFSPQQSFVPPGNLSMDMGAQFSFSPKHNGLYLYLGRILRPLWHMNCVQKVASETKKEFLMSSISSDECVWISSHLQALKSFLQRNTQISITSNFSSQSFNQFGQHDNTNTTNFNLTRMGPSIQDIQLEERHSLDALKNFVNQSCEIIGLWKILCEHQFHLLIESLSKEHQIALTNMTFKDFLLFGNEMCSVLIISLINSYLGDNASVDSISAKLRDVCPTLYKNEDAACSKANEILLSVKSQQSREEKEAMLQSALQLCKDIAPNLNLQAACQKFMACQFYNAVIDLCVTCCKKVDPENIAEHYYKTKDPADDHDGYHFYAKRMSIYKEVVNMLEHLYSQNATLNKSDIPATPGPPPKPQEGPSMSNTDINEITRSLISEILNNPDELLHVSLYDWMLNKRMFSELLEITEGSLENYLIRATQQNPNAIQVYDLLWKYYEANANHAAAAKILNTLASKPGAFLSLKQRIEYLARAVICMRSDIIGYAPHLGIFLRELEDKIEIAKVQEQILNALTNGRNIYNNIEDIVASLNSNLYDITALYEKFANPYQLWECQLAIIHCSGHNDRSLIHGIWENVIRTEFQNSKGTSVEKITQIMSKVKALVEVYRDSEHCFPLEHIINKLEEINQRFKINHSVIPATFINLEISTSVLIDIYHRMILMLDKNTIGESDFYLYKSLAEIIVYFIHNIAVYGKSERRKIISQSQDVISGILSTLYSKPNTQELVKILRSIQYRLNHL